MYVLLVITLESTRLAYVYPMINCRAEDYMVICQEQNSFMYTSIIIINIIGIGQSLCFKSIFCCDTISCALKLLYHHSDVIL